jgi:hypothetical protein
MGVHAFLETHVYKKVIYTPLPGRRSGASTNRKAIARGRAVDRSLYEYTEWACGRRAARPCRMHPYAHRLVRQFRAWKWRLVRCQSPVLVREWDILTRIDVVVYDTQRHCLLAIEIKTVRKHWRHTGGHSA